MFKLKNVEDLDLISNYTYTLISPPEVLLGKSVLKNATNLQENTHGEL